MSFLFCGCVRIVGYVCGVCDRGDVVCVFFFWYVWMCCAVVFVLVCMYVCGVGGSRVLCVCVCMLCVCLRVVLSL